MPRGSRSRRGPRARTDLGELELGVARPLRGAPGSSVPLAGMWGFRNRDGSLTWLGSSRRQGEPCALLSYEACFNTFELNLGPSSLQGSSHDRGLLWISIREGQLEHATLEEVVSVRTASEGRAPQRNDVLRPGVLATIPRFATEEPSRGH